MDSKMRVMVNPKAPGFVIVRKLVDHPYSNARVLIYENQDIELISYNTPVVYASRTSSLYRVYAIASGIGYGGSKLYMHTAARHISAFLREYFPEISYEIFKHTAAENGEVLLSELRQH